MPQKSKKNDIADTVMTLMLHSNLDYISVQDICREANVSKQCFYNHFKDKYDVIDWIYRTEAIDFLQFIGDNYSWYEAVVAKLNMVQMNSTFYRKVYRQEWFLSSFYEMTKKLYREIIHQRTDAETFQSIQYDIDFFVDACVRTTGRWVESGFNRTVEELLDSFLNCIPASIKPYLLTEKDILLIHDQAMKSKILFDQKKEAK